MFIVLSQHKQMIKPPQSGSRSQERCVLSRTHYFLKLLHKAQPQLKIQQISSLQNNKNSIISNANNLFLYFNCFLELTFKTYQVGKIFQYPIFICLNSRQCPGISLTGTQFQETFLSDCFLKRTVLCVKVLLSSKVHHSVGWCSKAHYRAMQSIHVSPVQLDTVQPSIVC